MYINKFIAKARDKFGNKYDYSKLNFVNTRTKVNIICPKHGPQSMYVHAHLSGTGCTMCGKELGGAKKLTTEDFVNKAKLVHKDKYDYSKTVYNGTHTDVIIGCTKHGDFKQTPSNHLAGSNCPKCVSASTFLTQDEYIKRVSTLHNNKYTYDKTKYVKNDQPIIITCPVHGDFEQTAFAHLYSKNGCPSCWEERRGISRRISLTEFILRAKEIHGNSYNYSKVVLSDTLKENVTINCKEHGDFEQTPDKHLQGNGCSKCSGKYQRSTEEFISDSKTIHGDKFGYDKCIYVNNMTPVTIKCDKHGYVTTNPRGHLNGSGCPKCFITNGESKVEKWLLSNHIEYIREYKLPNSNYRYDFYLPKLNILIEYDGQLHFIPVNFFGGKPHLEKIQYRDKLKNELAMIHNIPLIRISYLRYDMLEDFLLYKISKIYKYKNNGVFYKDFLELCRALNTSGETTPSDVIQFLTYKPS